MVRTYVRKSSKGAGFNYTEEDLQRAIEDVKNGKKTTRGAAHHYGIPRSTLKHYIQGTRGKGKKSGSGYGGGGVKSYLTLQEEEEIASCLKIMDHQGYGLTRLEVLELVEWYILENNLTTRFPNGRPGPDWLTNFQRRQGLSFKKPQALSNSPDST